MQTLRVAVFSLCTALIATLFGAALAPGARADQWDRKTVVPSAIRWKSQGRCCRRGPTSSDWPIARPTGTSSRFGMRMKRKSWQRPWPFPNSRSERPDKSIFEFEERAQRAHGTQSVVLSGRQHRTRVRLFRSSYSNSGRDGWRQG